MSNLINHIRTLLLNLPGDSPPGPGYPGEEYVPPDYRPVTLPAAAAAARRLLLGGPADRAMLNYRLRELTTVLHGTELAEATLASDPRVTYWPPRTGPSGGWPAGLNVVRLSAGQASLTPVGPPDPQEQFGRLYSEWQVSVQADGGVAVGYFDPGAGLGKTQIFSPGGVVTLPGSSLQVRVQGPPGSSWDVRGLARPSRGLPGVLADLDSGLGDSALEALFGRDPPEPYRTFRNLWFGHDQAAYRLGGLALAVAYRADETRRGP